MCNREGMVMLYDYIIVGAGLAGLLAGSILIEEEKRVLIIDKNQVVGGYLRDLMPGVPFGAHHIGIPNLKILNQFCDKLGFSIENHLKNADMVSIVLHNKKITLSLKLLEEKQQLMELFPEEAKGICNYFEYLSRFSEVLYAEDEKAVKKYFLELVNITFNDFLHRFFDNQELIELLSFLGPSYGGVNEEASAFTFASLIATYGSGAYYLDTDWLIEQLEGHVNNSKWGRIEYGFEARTMHFSEEKACYEIRDDKRRVLFAKKVVFASYFGTILKEYCETSKNQNNALKKILGMEIGPSAFRFYFKIDQKVNRHEWIYMGENPAIVSTLEQDACNVMVTFVSVAKKTQEEYETIAQTLVEQIFNVRNVKLIMTSTPNHKMQITNNKCGAVFGWKRNKVNNLTTNLIYNMHQYINNVYVVGNWGATFGFFGVLYTIHHFTTF